ncbi:MAG: heavy-metal-associated domain-containing protein [Syntrophales bacterium]|jgi:copper chaperone|nr:heavy-metal-associated domain-containing protein [Syntrophales bacterium]MCK9527358.1 heavy-metal-associated domain-containing protein [Syntrophales bacterium]MDX9921172.1 heavy-metal-associated domain-containing protein [Syntrophales bacterium]
MKKIVIRGMSCGHCVAAVTKALRGIEGIVDVTVDLERGEATYSETTPVDSGTVRDRIREAGYDVDREESFDGIEKNR